MANAPDTAPYLLAYSDVDELQNSRYFTVAQNSGLFYQDFGPGNAFAFTTLGALNALYNLEGTGWMCFLDNVDPYFAMRTFTSSDTSITITNPTGAGGNPNFTVAASKTVQKLNFLYNDGALGTGSNLNIQAGTGISVVTNFDSGGAGKATYTINRDSSGDTDQWSTFAAVSDVDMDGNNILNLNSLALQNISLLVPSTTDYLFSHNHLLFFSNTTIGGNRAVVTTAATNYGLDQSLLIGNGVDYAILPKGAIGKVVGINDDGDVAYITNGGGGGGAPTDATYILQTANGDLADAQVLADLDTGLLKSTITTGVLSRAEPATTSAENDYMAGSMSLASIADLTVEVGSLLIGGEDNLFVELPLSDTPYQYLRTNSDASNVEYGGLRGPILLPPTNLFDGVPPISFGGDNPDMGITGDVTGSYLALTTGPNAATFYLRSTGFDVEEEGGTNLNDWSFRKFANGSNPNNFLFISSNRGSNQGSAVAMQEGDVVGGITGEGWGGDDDTGDYVPIGKITFEVGSDFTTDNAETLIKFYVVPADSITPTLALVLNSDSSSDFYGVIKGPVLNVGIGSSGTPSMTFNSEGTPTGSGFYYDGGICVSFETDRVLQISGTDIRSELPILGPDGTVGSPVYSFGNANDSGMYYLAPGIGFSYGGDLIFSYTDSLVTFAQPVLVDNTNFVVYNTNGTPTVVITADDTGDSALVIDGYASPPVMEINAYRGHQGTAAAIHTGDVLGTLKFQGYNGANTIEGFSFSVVASENFASGHGGVTASLSTVPTGSATPAVRMTINDIGQIGIGATMATHDFELVTSDDAAKTTTATWATTSDVRIKRDIENIDFALDVIEKVAPRKFKYTEEHIKYLNSLTDDGDCGISKDKEYYGFIADELQKVMPSCVRVSDDKSGDHENLKMVNVHNLNVVLLRAVQELSEKVKALEAKQ